MSLFGVYLSACLLLAGAGLAKAARPATTALALRRALPALAGQRALTEVAVRAVAAAEAALGVLALAFPVPASAGLVAASFTCFTVAVAVMRRRGGPLATCGCFGDPDTPATWLHAAIDAGLALAAFTVALAAGGGGSAVGGGSGGSGGSDFRHGTLAGALHGQPWAGVPLVAASVVTAVLCFLAMTGMARLWAVRREPVT